MKHYSEELNSFIFRKSWNKLFLSLPSAKAGEVIQAICAYTEGDEIELDDLALNSVVIAITADIENNAHKYLYRIKHPGENNAYKYLYKVSDEE